MAGSASSGATRRRVVKAPGERRDELLTAATRVFRRSGLAEARIADITAEAGVAVGSFYLHFQSKEELLAGMKERFVDDAFDRMAAVRASVAPGDYATLFDHLAEAIVSFMFERADDVLVFAQQGATPEAYRQTSEHERRIVQLYVPPIRDGVAAGAFHVDDPEITAWMLHNAIVHTTTAAIVLDDRGSQARITAAARQLVRRVLGADR